MLLVNISFPYSPFYSSLGVGSTANCHRCCRKSDAKEFACKVIDKRQIEVKFTGLLEQFYVEIKVLSELKHPNIIKLEDVFETNDRIFIVMELMSGGELFDYVVEKGTLSELEASRIVRKITSAIALMHSLGIIHRDLKPENLLLTSKGADAEVKLIDFGLAKV
jgi:calcium/calmodulin-dependent protein kinase I